ncbi:hypothetical protein DFAR_3820001 [Desulfarculales bacterium]
MLTPAPESSPILHPNTSGAGYFDRLRVLGLEGMLKAIEEQLNTPEAQKLGFAERLGLMVDMEAIHRANCRLKNRLDKTKLGGHPPPGRLGTGETVTGAEFEYARSPVRPLRPRLHYRHRPIAC